MRLLATSWAVRSLLCSAFVALTASAAGAGSIVYVDDDAPAGGDGTSWATAFPFLQDGLAFAAVPQHGVSEVRVAQGVYKPDRSEASPNGTGDSAATFQLINGVALHGGYRGLNNDNLNPDHHNIDVFQATLSGNLQSPGARSLHVVTGNAVDRSASMEGFTIVDGYAIRSFFGSSEPELDGVGGGCLVFEGAPVIRYCRFESNTAEDFGGGLYYGNTKEDVIVEHCVFRNNDSWFLGGGLVAASLLTTRVDSCTFSNNTGLGEGQNLVAEGKNGAWVDSCRFFRSNSNGFSDAYLIGVASVENCLFAGQFGPGGAIFADLAFLINTSIACDQSPFQGKVFLVNNSILAVVDSSTVPSAAFSYSLIPGNYGEGKGGIIHGDPLFIDADGVDNILGTLDDNLRLRPGSPCVDAADNLSVPRGVTTDLGGHPRFIDDPSTPDTGAGSPPIVDMGAYEFNPACIADVHPTPDGDGTIGIGDLLFIIQYCGATGAHSADVTFDGSVGIADLLGVIAAWGACD